MDDLDRIPIRVQDFRGVVTGYSSLARGETIVPRAGGDRRFVELVACGVVLSVESPMNGLRIGVAPLEPEEYPLSIAKSP